MGVDEPREGTVRRGEVLTLVQRSLRRRDYQLLRADQDLGGLRFAPGRRSVARATTGQTGPLVLTAGPGGVEVRRHDGATVERARRGAAVIRAAQGPPSSWRRSGRWHRWTIATGEADLLHVTAAQGFVRSWARITAQRDLPEQAAVLLGVIGGFLALRELQAEVDASPAVGGFVAATGSG